MIALAACSGDSKTTLADAATMLEPPAAFTEVSSETLNGFEAITTQITFSTELSQAEACASARDTLQAWADQEIPEPRQGLPRTLCSFELRTPVNHQDIDLASALVRRVRNDDDTFVEDPNLPGGVEEVVIFFRIDK